MVSDDPPRRYATRLSPAERRPLLLDAALAVIVEHGYRGATLAAVAERAGVTKPVIYSVFEDRAAFLAALLEREEQRALAAIAAAIPELDGRDLADPARLRRTVAEGVSALLRAVRDDPAPWRLILADSDTTPEAVERRIGRHREQIHAAVESLVAGGLAAAGDRDLDAGLLAHALFAAVERFVRMAAEAPDAIDPARAGRVVAALLPSPA